MDTIRIRTTQNVDIEYELAGLGERILARLVDLGIVVAVIILIVFIPSIAAQADNIPADLVTGLAVLIFCLSYVFYDLILELTMNGQSIGKRIMKIRVVSLDGGRPKFGQFLLRWVMRIVDFSLTGNVAAIVSVAVSEKKQRLGDMVANTTLIKTQPKTPVVDFHTISIEDAYVPVFPEVSRLGDREINLIYDVMQAYRSNGNVDLITALAEKLKVKMDVRPPMDDFSFLQAILKDYQAYPHAGAY